MHVATQFERTARAAGAAFTLVLLENVDGTVAERLRDAGVDVLDCEVPGSGSNPDLRVGGVGHPNETLHARWGACVAARLRRLLSEGGDEATARTGRGQGARERSLDRRELPEPRPRRPQ